MSEENKALARKFFRMFELDDPRMADEIVAADYYNHDAPYPMIGLEGVKTGVTRFKKAFPDAQVKIAFRFKLLHTPVNFGNIFSLAGRTFTTE